MNETHGANEREADALGGPIRALVEAVRAALAASGVAPDALRVTLLDWSRGQRAASVRPRCDGDPDHDLTLTLGGETDEEACEAVRKALGRRLHSGREFWRAEVLKVQEQLTRSREREQRFEVMLAAFDGATSKPTQRPHPLSDAPPVSGVATALLPRPDPVLAAVEATRREWAEAARASTARAPLTAAQRERMWRLLRGDGCALCGRMTACGLRRCDECSATKETT